MNVNIALLCLLLQLNGALSTSQNMNGDYSVASGARQNVNFNTDYASKGQEFFDVWAPEIATRYGDVFWTDQGVLKLPQEIVERFAGKVMAITGYEQDQVMVQPPNEPGVNPDKDVSVPINWAYNHHYMAWMTGNYSKLVQVPVKSETNLTNEEDIWYNHGQTTKWVAVALPSAANRADTSIPVSQMFSEGNGGESRKSFHGYPKGYAQLIESPETWHITPMQIDTRNRECGVTINDIHNCTQFIPGPEPRQARYGRGAPHGTNYSGLLECPCNSRFGGDPMFYGKNTKTKVVTHNFMTVQQTQCRQNEGLSSAPACFDAVVSLFKENDMKINIINKTTDDNTIPIGCSLGRVDSHTVVAYFNSAKESKTNCSTSNLMTGETMSDVNVSVILAIDTKSDIVEMTISGPSSVWFGVGFNAQQMADQPWTLIINSTGVNERKLGVCGSADHHCPGIALAPSIKVISNKVTGNVRTVVVQRALKGKDRRNYYSFVPRSQGTIGLITAVGKSQEFAAHKARAPTTITLIMSAGQTCVCDPGAHAEICESDGTNCKNFVKHCIAAPAGSLLEQRNPTCNSRQYSGGLSCCINGHNLLDDDQVIPPELLRYHMKFRFWFEEYVPASANVNGVASHSNLERIYQQTEANAGEYDVPPSHPLVNLPVVGYPNILANETTPGTTCTGDCPNGTDCNCFHEIAYRWIPSPKKPMRLIYAGGHCHAPSCISIVLHRNDTGEVLCEQIPQLGKGNVHKNKFDESGYILIPPCLWGDDDGLNPSVLLPAGTPLLSVKKNHNTRMGHYGEMASWQMRGVYF